MKRLHHTLALDPSAAESSRRRQPKTGCAAHEKKIGAPPNQPKLLDAPPQIFLRATVALIKVGLITRIFIFKRHLSESVTELLQQANFIAESAGERILKIGQYLAKLRTRVGL